MGLTSGLQNFDSTAHASIEGPSQVTGQKRRENPRRSGDGSVGRYTLGHRPPEKGPGSGIRTEYSSPLPVERQKDVRPNASPYQPAGKNPGTCWCGSHPPCRLGILPLECRLAAAPARGLPVRRREHVVVPSKGDMFFAKRSPARRTSECKLLRRARREPSHQRTDSIGSAEEVE